MEYEQDMLRRYSYIKSLCVILEYGNLALGRWSQRILQIVEDYAKVPMTELDAITVGPYKLIYKIIFRLRIPTTTLTKLM